MLAGNPIFVHLIPENSIIKNKRNRKIPPIHVFDIVLHAILWYNYHYNGIAIVIMV